MRASLLITSQAGGCARAAAQKSFSLRMQVNKKAPCGRLRKGCFCPIECDVIYLYPLAASQVIPALDVWERARGWKLSNLQILISKSIPVVDFFNDITHLHIGECRITGQAHLFPMDGLSNGKLLMV